MTLCRLGLIMLVLLTSACTTTDKPLLGESVTLKPGWQALKRSARDAVADPKLWGSLLAIGVLQATNLDQELSDQLREHTPLFNSNSQAEARSDDLSELTAVAYISTGLLAPGPADSGQWLSAKARLLGAEWASVKLTRSTASAIKSISKRQRPNALNDRSFPSGHATSASIQAQMANLNVDYLNASDAFKRNLQWGFDGLAVLTGWARVEAGMHYPSDVLAGWVLGQFTGYLAKSFITPDKEPVFVYPQLYDDGIGVRLSGRF